MGMTREVGGSRGSTPSSRGLMAFGTLLATATVAACQLGRRFHGIENHEEYRHLSERRLASYGTPKTCPSLGKKSGS